MQLSELLRSAQLDEGRCTAVVTDDWLNGRTTFGGLQAAIAVRAMRTLVPESVPLRTLQATFMAPVPGGAVTAQARLLRSGKSTRHVEARLMQGDQALALMVGVFGTSRPSTVAVSPAQQSVIATKPFHAKYIPGVMPSFLQHFDNHWLRGGPLFSGATDCGLVIETTLLDSGTATEAHVLMIGDLIPPIALAHLRAPTTGSSMTWMLDFIADRIDHLPLERWRIDAELQMARDGYTNQSAVIWGPNGEPIALSRQSMVVFG